MRVYILVLVIFFVSCNGEKQPVQAPETRDNNSTVLTPAQIKNAAIEVDSVGIHGLNEVVTVNGYAEVPPQNIVSVSFPLGGFLRNTNLHSGSQVKKGQVMATMQDQSLIQLQQDFLMARSRLSLLEKTYERQKLLNEQKISADKIFQQAEEEYHSQKILVSALSEKLRLINIDPHALTEGKISRTVPVYAPISGFVSAVPVNIGKYVNPTDVLFELIDPHDIHAVLTVFEKDLGKITVGQKVTVTFPDDPARSYFGEVFLVTRNVAENRTGLVHCEFTEKPATLLPGTFLNAAIAISASESPAVPEEAIVRHGGKQYVIEVTNDSIFHLTAVETGFRDQGMVELVGEGKDLLGHRIITKNPYAVLSRMKSADGE